MFDNRPLLSVVMIVKNERDTIIRTLDSIVSHVDWVTILDTGSTDGTQEAVKAYFKEYKLPGAVYEKEFIDFATARNNAFDLNDHEPRPHFALVLDGGDRIDKPSELRETCFHLLREEKGAYYIHVWDGDSDYYQTRLIRCDKGWRYVGRIHEALMSPDRSECHGPKLEMFRILRPSQEEGMARRKERFHRDLAILTEDHKKTPSDSRVVFFLGQTNEGLERYDEAAKWYKRRLKMERGSEEAWEACYRYALCSTKLGIPWPNLQQLFLEAYSMRPDRAEPLYSLAAWYHAQDNHALTYLFALMGAEIPEPQEQYGLVRTKIYRWVLSDLIAIHAWFLGQYGIGLAHGMRALENCPEDQRERIRKNVEGYHVYAGALPITRTHSENQPEGSVDRPAVETDPPNAGDARKPT